MGCMGQGLQGGVDEDVQKPVLFLEEFAKLDEVGNGDVYVVDVEFEAFEVFVPLQAVDELEHAILFGRATSIAPCLLVDVQPQVAQLAHPLHHVGHPLQRRQSLIVGHPQLQVPNRGHVF